jgi:hypothetical protein
MDVDSSTLTTSSPSYTILRIKRKRNEEPLDALGKYLIRVIDLNFDLLAHGQVVERNVRRKKSRGGVGVFQYAQTVEDDVWKDEKSQKDIQVRPG